MKKTISITLNETIFQIEEDAYHKLDEYLKSIKDFYGATEGEEIIFDIEASIAEKFSQKLEKNKGIITLKDVEEEIKVMGAVNEFEENIEAEPSLEEKMFDKDRRLFRNPDDVILGGVCSGIAAYFNIDPLVVRLLFIIFTFFWGSGLLIYLILWVIVPEAKNSAQKLAMRGKSVNLEEIQELVRENSKKLKEEGKNIIENVKKNKGSIYKILYFPVKLLGILFAFLKKFGWVFLLFLNILIGLVFLIGSIAAVIGLTVAVGVLLFNINSPYIVSDIPLAELSSSIYYYAGIISVYFIALIPFLFLTMLGVTMMRRKNSFYKIFSVILLVIWIFAIAGASVSSADIAPRINAYLVKTQKEKIVKEYNFKDFSKMNLMGENLNVNLVKGDKFKVETSGEAKDLEQLSVSLNNGELTIERKLKDREGQWCFICWNKDITATIVLPKLDSVKGSKYAEIKMEGFSNNISLNLSGYSELDWENSTELNKKPYNIDINLKNYSELKAYNLNIKQLKISQSEYSDLYLSGQANVLKAELSSYSKLDGSDFVTKQASIKALDYSNVTMGVTENLYAFAKNYSDIIYIGQPTVVDLNKSNYSNISHQD